MGALDGQVVVFGSGRTARGTRADRPDGSAAGRGRQGDHHSLVSPIADSRSARHAALYTKVYSFWSDDLTTRCAPMTGSVSMPNSRHAGPEVHVDIRRRIRGGRCTRRVRADVPKWRPASQRVSSLMKLFDGPAVPGRRSDRYAARHLRASEECAATPRLRCNEERLAAALMHSRNLQPPVGIYR